MPQIASPLSSPDGVPIISDVFVGKAPAPHFPSFAAFLDAVTFGHVGYAVDTWRPGLHMTVSGEAPNIRRRWNGSHARTVEVGTVTFVLPANTNTVLPTSGVPSSGVGADGDYAVDEAASVYYGPKASGAWPAGASIVGAVTVSPSGPSLTGPTPGPLPAYLGPIAGRSNAMKSGGVADTFSFCAVESLERFNQYTAQIGFWYAPGEAMKAHSSSYTQGVGAIRGAVIIQDGVAYDLKLGGSSTFSVNYGDLQEAVSPVLPRYFQPGELFYVGLIVHQTPHSDNSNSNYLAGSVMFNAAIGPGDVTFTSDGTHDPATWLAALRSGTIPTTLAGGTRGAIGVFPTGHLAQTTKYTIYWQGTSRDQGTDTNGVSGLDVNMPMSGLNGEGCKLAGFHFGVLNGGINSEGLRHIVSADNIGARKKMAARCSHFCFSQVVNDIGSNAAMANPLTAVATMKSECDRVQAVFVAANPSIPVQPRIVTASRPTGGSSDYFTTNVSQGGFWQAWADINMAARQHKLGNMHHFEIEYPLTSASGLIKIPSNARINTTQNLAIQFNRPDRTDLPGAILITNGNFWTPADHGSTVLIEGAAADGGPLYAMIGTRQNLDGTFDQTWANLYVYRGFKNKVFVQESQCSGTVILVTGVRTINISISSSTRMLMGAQQYTIDNIHSTPMGEDLLMPYNAAAGLLRLPGMD